MHPVYQVGTRNRWITKMTLTKCPESLDHYTYLESVPSQFGQLAIRKIKKPGTASKNG